MIKRRKVQDPFYIVTVGIMTAIFLIMTIIGAILNINAWEGGFIMVIVWGMITLFAWDMETRD